MDKDEEIKHEVVKEIKRERKINNPDRIEVTVKEGVVTLSGHVDHYMDQITAVAAAESVPGVEGVAQEIEVELPAASKRDDIEIAHSACAALEYNSIIPRERVKVSVSDGWITLEGDLQEEHQKKEAENTVSKVLGVRGVTNNIVVRLQLKPYDITLQIQRTFQHMAIHHAQDIHVEIKDGKVILSGMVRAWIEKAEAEEAAHEVQGVTDVENRLEVTPLLEGKEKPPVKEFSTSVTTTKSRSSTKKLAK
jgi:osmotically-inducible protein OsmY